MKLKIVKDELGIVPNECEIEHLKISHFADLNKLDEIMKAKISCEMNIRDARNEFTPFSAYIINLKFKKYFKGFDMRLNYSNIFNVLNSQENLLTKFVNNNVYNQEENNNEAVIMSYKKFLSVYRPLAKFSDEVSSQLDLFEDVEKVRSLTPKEVNRNKELWTLFEDMVYYTVDDEWGYSYKDKYFEYKEMVTKYIYMTYITPLVADFEINDVEKEMLVSMMNTEDAKDIMLDFIDSTKNMNR